MLGFALQYMLKKNKIKKVKLNNSCWVLLIHSTGMHIHLLHANNKNMEVKFKEFSNTPSTYCLVLVLNYSNEPLEMKVGKMMGFK